MQAPIIVTGGTGTLGRRVAARVGALKNTGSEWRRASA